MENKSENTLKIGELNQKNSNKTVIIQKIRNVNRKNNVQNTRFNAAKKPRNIDMNVDNDNVHINDFKNYSMNNILDISMNNLNKKNKSFSKLEIEEKNQHPKIIIQKIINKSDKNKKMLSFFNEQKPNISQLREDYKKFYTESNRQNNIKKDSDILRDTSNKENFDENYNYYQNIEQRNIEKIFPKNIINEANHHYSMKIINNTNNKYKYINKNNNNSQKEIIENFNDLKIKNNNKEININDNTQCNYDNKVQSIIQGKIPIPQGQRFVDKKIENIISNEANIYDINSQISQNQYFAYNINNNLENKPKIILKNEKENIIKNKDENIIQIQHQNNKINSNYNLDHNINNNNSNPLLLRNNKMNIIEQNLNTNKIPSYQNMNLSNNSNIKYNQLSMVLQPNIQKSNLNIISTQIKNQNIILDNNILSNNFNINPLNNIQIPPPTNNKIINQNNIILPQENVFLNAVPQQTLKQNDINIKNLQINSNINIDNIFNKNTQQGLDNFYNPLTLNVNQIQKSNSNPDIFNNKILQKNPNYFINQNNDIIQKLNINSLKENTFNNSNENLKNISSNRMNINNNQLINMPVNQNISNSNINILSQNQNMNILQNDININTVNKNNINIIQQPPDMNSAKKQNNNISQIEPQNMNISQKINLNLFQNFSNINQYPVNKIQPIVNINKQVNQNSNMIQLQNIDIKKDLFSNYQEQNINYPIYKDINSNNNKQLNDFRNYDKNYENLNQQNNDIKNKETIFSNNQIKENELKKNNYINTNNELIYHQINNNNPQQNIRQSQQNLQNIPKNEIVYYLNENIQPKSFEQLNFNPNKEQKQIISNNSVNTINNSNNIINKQEIVKPELNKNFINFDKSISMKDSQQNNKENNPQQMKNKKNVNGKRKIQRTNILKLKDTNNHKPTKQYKIERLRPVYQIPPSKKRSISQGKPLNFIHKYYDENYILEDDEECSSNK